MVDFRNYLIKPCYYYWFAVRKRGTDDPWKPIGETFAKDLTQAFELKRLTWKANVWDMMPIKKEKGAKL